MDLIQEQIEYYRARASEYDEWFLRQGRYDRGEAHKERWFAEARQLQEALANFEPRGDILELACGTGWWTEHLLPYVHTLTAVDASEEVLALNRRRIQSDRVNYIQADLFTWEPERRFDTIFFSFWLSHVPPERFETFWHSLRGWLNPDGRVFFIDSSYEASSTAKDQQLRGRDESAVTRHLNNGRTFEIVKVFYQPKALEGRLERLGWSAEVEQTDTFFLYANAAPKEVQAQQLYGRTDWNSAGIIL